MKGTIKLGNPIMINNKMVDELPYDTDEITGLHFAEADAKRRMAAGSKNVSIAPAAEFDYSMHLYLGFAAVVAANPAYDFADLERVHGRDVVEIMQVGRNFILKSDKSETDSSDEPTANMPVPSTQASLTYKSGE